MSCNKRLTILHCRGQAVKTTFCRSRLPPARGRGKYYPPAEQENDSLPLVLLTSLLSRSQQGKHESAARSSGAGGNDGHVAHIVGFDDGEGPASVAEARMRARNSWREQDWA